jgi:DNA helicase-2/ATP-dependent DNA helicase PcrA
MYRTNAQSRAVEDQLRKANIPYRIVAGLRFYDRKEIQDILSYLTLIVNPDDNNALSRIVNEPKRGLGATSLGRFFDFAESRNLSYLNAIDQADQFDQLSAKAIKTLKEFSAMIKNFIDQSKFLGVTDMVQEVLDKTQYRQLLAEKRNDLEAQTRVENIDEFITSTKQFDQDYQPDAEGSAGPLLDFIGTAALASSPSEERQNSDEVILTTMHAAKGLEFPIVFIIGMEEGIFPSGRSMEERDDLEEERRLAYVGITRAREELFLTNAYGRMLYGRTQVNDPSRFLDEIDNQLMDQIDNTAPTITVIGNDLPFSKRNLAANANTYEPTGAEEVDWKIGEKVNHKKWGQGLIVGINGSGEETVLKIAFNQQGIKELLATFAPITKAS